MASPHGNNFDNNSCLPCTGFKNLQEAKRSSQGHSNTEMKQTEDILSNELNKLSLKERSEAYDDVHCVGDELKETPEMIQKSLMEFDEAIPKYRNAAYETALKQNKAFVEDPSFRLKFLRAQMHDVDKAVDQMMNFLHYKGEYFGYDKIAREITLDDLTEEDMELMMSDQLHIQAGRDRMGRVVVYCLSKLYGRFKPESTFRVGYYKWYNILISRHDVQMKGLVDIYLDTSRPEDEDLVPENDAAFRKMLDAAFSIPYRNSAMHYCFNKADKRSLMLDNAFLSFCTSVFPVYSRVRTRVHYGTIMELQYKLRSYGIPMDTFPVDMNGRIREDIMNVWFYEHQAKESTKMLACEGFDRNEMHGSPRLWSGVAEAPRETPYTKVASVTTPSDSDVLSGRGRVFQDHPGNVRFRKFVEGHSKEYDMLDRHDRMVFTIRLTHVLEADNFRFLKQTTRGDWVTLDASEVRKKVSQQFRTSRKKKK